MSKLIIVSGKDTSAQGKWAVKWQAEDSEHRVITADFDEAKYALYNGLDVALLSLWLADHSITTMRFPNTRSRPSE